MSPPRPQSGLTREQGLCEWDLSRMEMGSCQSITAQEEPGSRTATGRSCLLHSALKFGSKIQLPKIPKVLLDKCTLLFSL